MTEIAGVGAVNAGLVRNAVQNEEQQFAKQQAQIKGEVEEFAQRRVEQSQAGANNAGDNPGAEDLDFSSDDLQRIQVDDSLRLESFAQNAVQEQVQEEDKAVQVSLSDAALDAQNQANRIATLNVGAAEQSLQDSIQQTEAGLDSNDFTRIVDDNRERDDASNIESRQTRELGRVLDTFA